MFVSIYRQCRSSSTSSQEEASGDQEYGLTIAELGYEPVKPGDNNDKPAQSSLKVDRPCNVGQFLINIFFFIIFMFMHDCVEIQEPARESEPCRLRHTGPGLYSMYVIHTILTRSRSAQKLCPEHLSSAYLGNL